MDESLHRDGCLLWTLYGTYIKAITWYVITYLATQLCVNTWEAVPMPSETKTVKIIRDIGKPGVRRETPTIN